MGTPGDLIANIPGILGFFPTESIVFAAMFQDGQSTRYNLGPVVRIDVHELDLLPEVGAALQSVEADLIFAFVISEKVTSTAIEKTVDKLFTTAEAGIIDITACWLTAGIYSGENYQLAFGPQPEDLTTTCSTMSQWEHGRVAPVTQAVATRNLLEHGQLPEANRRDAYAAFDRGSPILNEDQIWDLAYGQRNGQITPSTASNIIPTVWPLMQPWRILSRLSNGPVQRRQETASPP